MRDRTILADSHDDRHWEAGSLAQDVPIFDPATTCGQAFDWFREHREQVATAVVDQNGHVVGLVNRLRFLARYAQPYIPELYSRQSVLKLANTRPLIVDEQLPLMELAGMLTFDWPDALRECFVITRGGRYVGIGTSEALVRAKLGMLKAHEERLQSALYAAEHANKAKGNFLALMSHELRTPLNAIIGFSQVLSGELFGPHVVERYKEYSGDIQAAGTHLLALINDILDLSKSEAGKLELHEERVDVPGLFAECLRLVADRAQESGVKLAGHIADDFPDVSADRLRMKQILLNLLSNAVKFTPAGGDILLSGALQADAAVRITVADTGIGMAPESIPTALEPFRQIDSPLSRKAEGTGLGLALVKTLIEGHGGSIQIDSALNKGTVVHVTLPPARTLLESAENYPAASFGT